MLLIGMSFRLHLMVDIDVVAIRAKGPCKKQKTSQHCQRAMQNVGKTCCTLATSLGSELPKGAFWRFSEWAFLANWGTARAGGFIPVRTIILKSVGPPLFDTTPVCF